MQKRDKNFDYTFFKQNGVGFKWHQPWQVSLFLEDFEGKFVWYPEKGTLMVEFPEWGGRKIGEYTDSEEVYIAMNDHVQNQQ